MRVIGVERREGVGPGVIDFDADDEMRVGRADDLEPAVERAIFHADIGDHDAQARGIGRGGRRGLVAPAARVRQHLGDLNPDGEGEEGEERPFPGVGVFDAHVGEAENDEQESAEGGDLGAGKIEDADPPGAAANEGQRGLDDHDEAQHGESEFERDHVRQTRGRRRCSGRTAGGGDFGKLTETDGR